MKKKTERTPMTEKPSKKTAAQLRTESESDVDSVIQFLKLEGHYCSRVQSQGQYSETLSRWMPSKNKRGLSDIMAVIRGRSIMIEIKVGSDVQSEHQKQTQSAIESSGGFYLIVRSVNGFMDWYFIWHKKIGGG